MGSQHCVDFYVQGICTRVIAKNMDVLLASHRDHKILMELPRDLVRGQMRRHSAG